MARKKREVERSGRTVLLIDDNEDYLTAARRIIERDGHEVIAAPGGREGLAILRTREVDLVLVDYLMPGMTGEEFVREMRLFRPTTQVILQTGYASENPPRELLRRLDIQGFHDKSDGPEKLSLWVDVGLKAAFTVQLLTKSRIGLRFILDATPELHRIQPLDDLLQGVLHQMVGLLGATHSFVASTPPDAQEPRLGEGFLAMTQDEDNLFVRAATGRFNVASRIEDCLDQPAIEAVAGALTSVGITMTKETTIAPLRVGGRTIGVVYLEGMTRTAQESELLELFANQAAVAIQNVALYEMAALDSLTGVSTRRFFEQATARELRVASRTGASLGLIVIDVDDMKAINDVTGHAAGDRALAALGARMRCAVRATDLVGRIGGDEFAILLPATDLEGVEIVRQRVARALGEITIDFEGRSLTFTASVGAAILRGPPPELASARQQVPAFLELAARALLQGADSAMYRSKRERHHSVPPSSVGWPMVTSHEPTSAQVCQ